jgi:hypothetical protein
MPDRHKTFARDEILPSYFPNAFQAFFSTAGIQFELRKFNATTIEVQAAAGEGLAGITIDGRFRYRETTVQAAHPGGAAATYDVWVTAADNVVSSSPLPFTDLTDYSFGLTIRASGSPPVGFAIMRKVGEVVWDGAAITRIRQLVEGFYRKTTDVGWSSPVGMTTRKALGSSYTMNELRDYVGTAVQAMLDDGDLVA